MGHPVFQDKRRSSWVPLGYQFTNSGAIEILFYNIVIQQSKRKNAFLQIDLVINSLRSPVFLDLTLSMRNSIITIQFTHIDGSFVIRKRGCITLYYSLKKVKSLRSLWYLLCTFHFDFQKMP